MVPTHMFLTRGVGVHKEKLASFEEALRSAGVAYCNLVSVSSILPPNCKIISRNRGEKLLSPGEITFCVMARSETNERNRLISASVGLAKPTDRNSYGYLSEHHAHGETDEETGEYTEDLAAQMLATTLGLEFDPNVAWKEREQVFKMGGKIVKTSNITQSAIGKAGKWTTVIALAVFIPGENVAKRYRR
ncbi:MAG: arginine decarboxylase, pyruvoyl-dependent [Nitrospira sp.]|uniref:Pyruvoyl-dependent arginine decarboxylase AaxB n=1 Tax=Candidatus Nitrospira inopinata TaxID=1715989 RepID=A0A0S4KQA6_9BACT|nr:arginine decarboxylase, pyruvoyl-dependent [Candidatus Nitrospira inopinata]MCA1957531.1 arginine decarboxylase, pyruvoyl-dependent [Nitrospira sp.]MCP9449979.1 arginine decarboxylase, pyruvoyl-dependent [Nitrospira sp.]MCP9461924.1 arginine decarboxylase, pyruvoyl-dependent [Nitrospira sp.]MCP9468732.1 arginine decarboxylase, pyruvoyl-dependent [Nitrospira sp.]MCP9471917.1 arginine decarboxylase, pyruvoyl-dependent [Nitrospira sp.]